MTTAIEIFTTVEDQLRTELSSIPVKRARVEALSATEFPALALELGEEPVNPLSKGVYLNALTLNVFAFASTLEARESLIADVKATLADVEIDDAQDDLVLASITRETAVPEAAGHVVFAATLAYAVGYVEE